MRVNPLLSSRDRALKIGDPPLSSSDVHEMLAVHGILSSILGARLQKNLSSLSFLKTNPMKALDQAEDCLFLE